MLFLGIVVKATCVPDRDGGDQVMEIRPGQKPGQWYPRLSAGQVDLDILGQRCTQIVEMSQKVLLYNAYRFNSIHPAC